MAVYTADYRNSRTKGSRCWGKAAELTLERETCVASGDASSSSDSLSKVRSIITDGCL